MSQAGGPFSLEAVTLNSPVVTGSQRWILLEFSGVIIDDSPWVRWLWRLLRATTGCSMNYAAFNELWYPQYIVPTCFFQVGCERALHAALAALEVPPALADELALAALSRRRAFEESEHAVPGVREALYRLRNLGYFVALLAICDCSRDRMQQRLRHAQLHDLFDAIICSRESLPVESSPDDDGEQRWWQGVARCLDSNPEQILFLSARVQHLTAARRAGMRAVGIDIGAESWDGPRLACLGELLVRAARPVKRLAV